MTPKEKAKELIVNFYSEISGLSKVYINNNWKYLGKLSLDSNFNTAMKCALIAVDEMTNIFKVTHIGYGKEVMNAYYKEKKKYWEQVKSEIKNL